MWPSARPGARTRRDVVRVDAGVQRGQPRRCTRASASSSGGGPRCGGHWPESRCEGGERSEHWWGAGSHCFDRGSRGFPPRGYAHSRSCADRRSATRTAGRTVRRIAPVGPRIAAGRGSTGRRPIAMSRRSRRGVAAVLPRPKGVFGEVRVERDVGGLGYDTNYTRTRSAEAFPMFKLPSSSHSRSSCAPNVRQLAAMAFSTA